MDYSTLTRLRVAITGRLSAPRTLVFAHGFGTDQSAWHRVQEAFAADNRIILFNLAGTADQGAHPFDEARYQTLDGFATDLLELCATLRLRDVHYVGHSASGMIGVLAALREPSYFAKLVLISASPRYLNDGEYQGGLPPEELRDFLRLMENDYPKWLASFVPFATAGTDPSRLDSYLRLMLGRMKPRHALVVLRAILQSDYRDQLSQLRIPTLILQSRQDPMVPWSVAELFQARIPGSVLEPMVVRGHFPHISAPNEIVAALKRFL